MSGCTKYKNARSQGNVEKDKRDGPFELMHERVEELESQNLSRARIKVVCKNLLKLVMNWRVDRIETFNITFTTFTTPALECPKLTSLEVGGYAHALQGIAQILGTIPSLETIKIS